MNRNRSGNLSRRRFLGNAVVVAGVTALPGASIADTAFAQAAAKAPQDAVKYQDQPKNGQRCSECTYFLPASSKGEPAHCKVVQGEISPDGWCMLFVAK